MYTVQVFGPTFIDEKRESVTLRQETPEKLST